MNKLIQKILESGSCVGKSGKEHKLHSSVDREEGEFLSGIIRENPGIVKTLEVGCAYGISSLFICSALEGREGASHTIIDPNQNTQWDGVGVKNLGDAGLDFFRLIEKKSEFALPQLLEEGEGRFDFIFIDGWHTFDHTLLDCFYATRLLRVGGILVIDDVTWPSVRRVVDYLANYPCYQFHGEVGRPIKKGRKDSLLRFLMSPLGRKSWAPKLSPAFHRKIFADQISSMVALRKVSEDKRGWDWHDDAF